MRGVAAVEKQPARAALAAPGLATSSPAKTHDNTAMPAGHGDILF